MKSLLYILGGALALCLPALWNRFPFLFPDSVDYIRLGKPIWEGLTGTPHDAYGFRSACYTLSILPLHAEARTVWPVIYAQALAVAWLLWRTGQLFQVGPIRYLLGMLLLGVGTGAGWTTSYLLPDILASTTILATFLLTQRPHWGVFLILVWSIVAHGSHLVLAPILALGASFFWTWRRAAPCWLALVVAIFLQLSLHARLYHEFNLMGKPPPFLLARLIEDGPLLHLLRTPGCQFALARHLERIQPSSGHFLWNSEGPFQAIRRDNPEEWELIVSEQRAMAWEALRQHPGWQTLASLKNSAAQFTRMALSKYHPNPHVIQVWPREAPTLEEAWLASRQAQQDIPGTQIGLMQTLVILLSLVVLARRKMNHPLWNQLYLFVLLSLIANAAICGSLSTVDDRYQARVAWLVVWLAWCYPGTASITKVLEVPPKRP